MVSRSLASEARVFGRDVRSQASQPAARTVRAWANNAQVILDQFKEATFSGVDLGLLEEADDCCRRSLALDPDEEIVPKILNLHAIILYQAGRLGPAEAACASADPDDLHGSGRIHG